jgi:hypothetical protein
MKATSIVPAALAVWLSIAVSDSVAVSASTTEEFTSSAANWKDFASLDLTHVPSGGPDGSGYVTTDFAFTSAPSGSSVLFRGHDAFNSSGDAFVGNWLAAGINRLSADVRHDAPEPVDFFLRLATPVNFPGMAIELPIAVQPNTWTRLAFDLSPGNPLLTVEGPPTAYAAILSNIGNLQISARVPAGLAQDATAYSFDLDRVNVVPEPTTLWFMVTLGMVVIAARTRLGRS